MAVNSYLIYEKLNNCFFRKLGRCTTECKIRYVTIYNPQIKMRSSTVYIIVDPRIFPENDSDEKCLLAVLGKPDVQAIENSMHDILCVEREVGLGGLYENLQEIIEYYNSWEDKMAQLLIGGSGLDRLCSISVPYFRNPLTVQNANFEMIGVGETQEIKYPYNFREGESDYLSEEWIESALNADFDIFSKKGPFVFNYIEAHKSLLMNIFMDEAFVAQICVDANHTDFVVEDFIRITILAKYVKQYLKYNAAALSANENRFAGQLKKYVGGSDNQKELQLSVRMKKWKTDGTYMCCVFEKDDERVRNISSEYFCRKCQEFFPESVAFLQEEKVFLLLNLSCDENEDDEIRQAMESLDDFAKEYLLFAGVSFPFEMFYDCRDYFSQANALLKLRDEIDASGRIYSFEEYKLKYAVKYGMASLPLKTLIPRGLNQLIAYDRENNGELFVTFKAYIKNYLNISDTANELFVHRSTFKYRLDKIKQILGPDFEEHNEQMYLQMLLFELEGSSAEEKNAYGESQVC